MNTKKSVLLIALVVGLSCAGFQQAFAKGGNGAGAPGNGPGINCPNAGQPPQMDEATKKKMDAFFKDTKELRKDIAMKQAEKRAIFMSEKIDPAAAAKVEGELFDLRDAMRQKADAAGVPFLGGMMGGDRGPGQGCMMQPMGPKGHNGPKGNNGPKGQMPPPQAPQSDMGGEQ